MQQTVNYSTKFELSYENTHWRKAVYVRRVFSKQFNKAGNLTQQMKIHRRKTICMQ